MSKPTAIEEVLYEYCSATQSIDEDLVLQQYPDKVEKAHRDNHEEALTQIEQLVREKVIGGDEAWNGIAKMGETRVLLYNELRRQQNQALTNLIRGEK